MPFLQDIQISAIPGDNPEQKLESLVKQINEWGRAISNEKRTDIYKDNAGTNRIIVGVLPDGNTGLVISKEGIDVLSIFS